MPTKLHQFLTQHPTPNNHHYHRSLTPQESRIVSQSSGCGYIYLGRDYSSTHDSFGLTIAFLRGPSSRLALPCLKFLGAVFCEYVAFSGCLGIMGLLPAQYSHGSINIHYGNTPLDTPASSKRPALHVHCGAS